MNLFQAESLWSFIEGEFYPADSIVRFLFNNETMELTLEEFSSLSNSGLKQRETEFYVSNSPEINGSGIGYGFIGEKEVPVDVFFELRIFKDSDKSENESGASEFLEQEEIENETEQNEQGEQVPDENREENEEVEQEQQTEEEIPNDEETSGDVEALIMGDAVKDDKKEKIIEGKIKLGEQFVYEVRNKEFAEIIFGSVETSDGKILDNSILTISKESR